MSPYILPAHRHVQYDTTLWIVFVFSRYLFCWYLWPQKMTKRFFSPLLSFPLSRSMSCFLLLHRYRCLCNVPQLHFLFLISLEVHNETVLPLSFPRPSVMFVAASAHRCGLSTSIGHCSSSGWVGFTALALCAFPDTPPSGCGGLIFVSAWSSGNRVAPPRPRKDRDRCGAQVPGGGPRRTTMNAVTCQLSVVNLCISSSCPVSQIFPHSPRAPRVHPINSPKTRRRRIL